MDEPAPALFQEGDAAAVVDCGSSADDQVVAFNFNNSTASILTGGGRHEQPIAGATDILMGYTWKLAFAAGKGADYGLASAVAIVTFFIGHLDDRLRTRVLRTSRERR